MLLLTGTSSILQVITGSASTIHAQADWVDYLASGPTYTPAEQNTAVITTATTTTLVPSPAASTQRNIRSVILTNVDAANSSLITLQRSDGTTILTVCSWNLTPGEIIIYTQGGNLFHLDKFGGIYQATTQAAVLFNNSTASQGAGFASDTYLTGSNILLPSSRPIVGTRYILSFEVEKTAAGTATPIFTVRYGTNATTADTALTTHTFGAGTAAADKAYVTVDAYFSAVGSGTSAVLQATVSLDTNLTTTGFSNAVKNIHTTSSGFASTTANTYLGLSINGGTSAAWTINQVFAKLENF